MRLILRYLLLTCGGCETARVSSHTFIAQQVVRNNVHELAKGGSSLLLSHTPTGQEQVPQDEAHGGCCDEFVRGLDRRLPDNFGLLDRCHLTM